VYAHHRSTTRNPCHGRGSVGFSLVVPTRLGEKRKQIAEEQIADIVGLYGDHAEGDRVKILANESFGFLRITVERPLRLRWHASAESSAALCATKAFAKLTEGERSALRERLGASAESSWTDSDDTLAALGSSKPMQKATPDALERDRRDRPARDRRVPQRDQRLPRRRGAARCARRLGRLGQDEGEPSVQAGFAVRFDSIAGQRDHARQELGRQIALLVERRQALITAAVTGELEIPGFAA